MKTIHAHAMLDEIAEESQIFSAILADKETYTRDFVRLCQSHNFKRIYIVGNGSPGWASVALKYAANKILKVDATYSTSGLFLHHEGFDVSGVYKPEEMLLICPAESGRTKGRCSLPVRLASWGFLWFAPRWNRMAFLQQSPMWSSLSRAVASTVSPRRKAILRVSSFCC